VISATSRYNTATLDVVTDERGTHQVAIPQPPQESVVTYTYYQFEEYDTADRIAEEVFGDGRLWWKIADANPEILDWRNIPVGTVIRLPVNG
jgi:nucleoid-associated protein YgaU